MSRPLADESVFRAVAHPARRRMLEILRQGERPVADLVASFRLSKQAISQHLRILRTAGLVLQHRNGRGRVYRIHPAQLRDIQRWVGPFEPLWSRK